VSTTRLGEAKTSLERGDVVGALGALVAAWVETRHPKIADLADAASQRIVPDEEPKGRRRKQPDTKADVWRADLERGPIEARERVYGSLISPRKPVTLGRLRSLVSAPLDPRMTKHLIAFLQSHKVGSVSWLVDVEARAIESLVRLNDVRFVEAFDQYAAEDAIGVDELPTKLKKALAAWRAFEPAQLGDSDAALVTEIGDLLAGRSAARSTGVTVEELFAAVYRDPRSLEARAVLADRLQEAGDPRGEFIALQCARDGKSPNPGKRERELLGKHADAWLGRIARAIDDGFVFERGFLARASFNGDRLPSGLGTQDEWSTVTHLSLWHLMYVGTERFLLSEKLAALEHVYALGPQDLRTLGQAPPRKWKTLELATPRPRQPRVNTKLEEDYLAIPKFAPNLERLVASALHLGPPLLDAILPALSKLRELCIGGDADFFTVMLERGRARSLASVELLGPGDVAFDFATRRVVVTFEDDDRRFSSSEHRGGRTWPMDDTTAAFAAAAIRRAPAFDLAAVEVWIPPLGKVTDGVLTRGRHERMSLAPIAAAAREAGVPFSTSKRSKD
jgi:uncharacterized protein (TIGR02996 family)